MESGAENILGRIRRRLMPFSRNPNLEARLTLARLLLGIPLTAALLYLDRPSLDAKGLLWNTLEIKAAFAFALLMALLVAWRPAPSKARRLAGLIGDLSLVTLILTTGNSAVAPLYLTYPLLLQQQSLGRSRDNLYLHKLLLINASFGPVLLFSSYWRQLSPLGEALWLGLMVLSWVLYSDRRAEMRESAIARNSQPGEAPAGSDGNRPDSTENQLHSSAPLRVLIVSDDPQDRHHVRRWLKAWGMHPDLCENSIRAFAALVSGIPYDAVVVDQRHLDMDPVQFAVSLRNEPELTSLSLVLLSPPLRSRGAEEKLLRAGYSRVLTTPLEKPLLYNALHIGSQLAASGNQVVSLSERYVGGERRQPLDVLVADGQANDRKRLEHYLKRSGHRVFPVESGAQALDALDTHHFDLAILAADMPEVTGLEAMKLYRFTRLDQAWVPFILLIDNPGTDNIRECEDAGADAWLGKPLEEQWLAETVGKVMERQAGDNLTSVPALPLMEGGERQLLDLQRLRELGQLTSNPGFLLNLVDHFHKDARHCLERMAGHLGNNQVSGYREQAQALHESAINLGAIGLYRLTRRATRLRKEELSSLGQELLQELDHCVQLTRQALISELRMEDTQSHRSE